jgi:ABC-type amino acid transport substrate-binding protein
MDLRKLVVGRIDVILEPDVVLDRYLAGADAPAVRKLSPPVRVTNRYAPVSKRFAANYPEFTSRFWLELARQARAGAAPTPVLP